MSKELVDRLENLAVHLKGTVYLHPEHVTALGEAIAALRSEPVYQQDALDMADKRADARHNKLNIDSVEPVAGQLSAEQINQYKQFASRLRSGDGILDEPLDWNALSEAIHTAADTINALCDMALSSLRGTFADGIEAAAKAAHESLRDIDRAHAEIAYSAASALKGASHD